jgi:uncharacterized protein (TIGR02996 family)
MPSPGHEPFLRAICAAPDDDAPRLVYADWLDEHGHPDRAEFIRKHIAGARDRDVHELGCQVLFRAKGRAWVAGLPGTVGLWAEFVASSVPRPNARHLEIGGESGRVDTWVECEPVLTDWERGFPAAIYVQGDTDLFFAHLDEVREFVPVRRLRLSNLPDPDRFVQTIAGQPFLSKIRDLLLSGVWLSDDAVAALASSPFAAELRFVALRADRLTDRAGRALAASPFLGGVEMLHLLRNQFSDEVVSALRARYGFRVHC